MPRGQAGRWGGTRLLFWTLTLLLPRTGLGGHPDLDDVTRDKQHGRVPQFQRELQEHLRNENMTELEDVMKETDTLLEQVKTLQKVVEGSESKRPMLDKLFVLSEDDPSLWKQGTLRRHGGYGFISYSAYRIRPSLIAVVGLGRTGLREYRQRGPCVWVWNNGTKITGTMTLHYTRGMNKLYELVLMECDFADPDRDFGLSSDIGGFLEVELDREIFFPFREDHGYSIKAEDSKGPFDYRLLYCGPPIYGTVFMPSITQWISFHRYHLGVDHFVFYDQAVLNGAVGDALQPLVKEGVLEIKDFAELLNFDIMMQGQLVQMHDCLFQFKDVARWIMYADFDEYIQVPPPLTFPDVLRKYANATSITQGCYEFSVERCETDQIWAPSTGKFAVEMLLYRDRQPHCWSGRQKPHTCWGSFGHRKIFLNPRKVFHVGVHTVEKPTEGNLLLDVDEIRHAHYRGFHDPANVCTKVKTQHSKFDTWWHPSFNVTDVVKDTSIAEIAAKARACEKINFANKARCYPRVTKRKRRRRKPA